MVASNLVFPASVAPLTGTDVDTMVIDEIANAAIFPAAVALASDVQ